MTVNIIAEIGSNWEGDIELGKQHIKKAKECGATHVKFQMWRAEDIYESTDPDWNEIKKSQLDENTAIELKKYSDNLGIKWFCSVFYPESVEFLESLNVELYKIASWTTALKHNFALETIEKVGETKKKTFISTGNGIDKNIIEKQFDENTFQYTYCIAKYPALDKDIIWNDLLKYDFFSDHTLGITMPLSFAILKNATGNNEIFIEKHVKLDKSIGPDAPFSITFDELQELTQHITRIEKMNLSNTLK
ncbi:N-acetylneuraminate synthase family protein [Nitrosopumilus sp.]|uniref:N-acetylneuraminate synthase family protein n=1 Tax=Nitrosopumilus sp. TaxID=2024843 RepID=UPI003D14BDAD